MGYQAVISPAEKKAAPFTTAGSTAQPTEKNKESNSLAAHKQVQHDIQTMEIISRKEALAKGLPRYFTGKPCRNGHIAERKTNKAECIQCKLESRRRLYAANPKKIYAQNYASRKRHWDAAVEYEKRYHAANPDVRKRAQSNYKQCHKDRLREKRFAKYAENRESQILKSRLWRKNNPEKVRAATARYYALNSHKYKEYRRNNVEAYRIYKQNRRAREAAGGGRVSKDITDKLLRLQRGKCACCHVELSKVEFHLDHIIPLAKGGKHSDENMQLLCKPCNLSKSDRLPHEFMQKRGFLL